jgi:hypothetical protein
MRAAARPPSLVVRRAGGLARARAQGNHPARMMPGAPHGATVTIDDHWLTLRDGVMANNGVKGTSGPKVRPVPLVTGGALIAAGGVLALAGFVVGGLHLLAATRQWIKEMEIPPSELAKLKLAQARAAAAAGAGAWQNGPAAAGTRSS